MSDDKLSAREAALIAQARAQLGKTPAAREDAAATAPVARADRMLAAAAIEPVAPLSVEPVAPLRRIEPVAPGGAQPAPAADPAERIAALIAAARAETKRQRQRRKMLYVWVPFACMAVTGISTLLWIWHKL